MEKPNNNTSSNTHHVIPSNNSLYPARDSLEAVITQANNELPITSENQLKRILMTYHNTLLKLLKL